MGQASFHSLVVRAIIINNFGEVVPMQTIKKRGLAVPHQQEQEIVTIAHRISAVLSKYRRPALIVLSVAVALAVAWGGYSLLRSQKELQASPLISAAYEFYKPATGAPADYGKALELFREISAKYSGTTSGAIAQYYTGNCLADLGKTDEAVKEYQEFIKRYGGDKFLLGLVQQRLGYAYLQSGKPDEAKKSFEQSELLLGPGAATVELAKQYEAAGNQAEAEKKYKTILEKMAGTTWSREAMGKVEKIASSPAPASGAQSK
jgi:tetratricopeptide (TPR) repeat protein